MPVSHVGLTVSHLPTSCSFFLAALSPLGYRYQGQQDKQIGLGVDQADFFICQQSPGTPPGAAHIAFSAPSPAAVNSFFTSALKAGGRIHGEPAVRDPKTGYYSAAVIDLDGNSVEVVHRPEDQELAGSKVSDCPSGNRVLIWQKDVAQSVVSYTPTVERSVARSVVRSVTTPTLTVTQPPAVLERRSSEDTASKTLIGSLIGAAAGAAIAYAMSTSEQEKSPGVSLQPALAGLSGLYRAIQAPPTPSQSPRSAVSVHNYHPPSPSYHAAPTVSSSSYHTSYQPRAIEAPGSHSPIVEDSKCPTEVSRHSSQSHRPSLARSSHTAPVVVQKPSRPTVARSSTSSSPKTVIQADYPPAASAHKAPKSTASQHRKDDYRSTVSRSRHGSYIASPKEKEPSGPIVEEVDDDAVTVAPSDSISQVGGKKRHKHRPHRGERKDGEKGEKSDKKSVVSLPIRGERGREKNGSRRTVIF
ncbi:hypothetical protein MMC30_007293 [Trapelia coarctata]|nr:hypothetical protein [Trapelia coarctata]